MASAIWLALLTPIALRVMHLLEEGFAAAMLGFGVAFTCLLALPWILLVDLGSAIERRRRARRETRTRMPAQPVPVDPVLAASGHEPAQVDARERDPSLAKAGHDEPIVLTRREAIRRASVGVSLAIGGGSTAYGMTFGRHDYALEEQAFRLARLPRTLDGYTIAQISDVHVGAFVGDAELRAAEALLRCVRPDLIVLTGDLIDHDVRYTPCLGAFVRRLAELGARDGVVAIAGNHDYYAGVEDVLETLREAGARVLRNDGLLVPDGERASAAEVTRGFSLLGVDDVWARRYGEEGGTDLPRTLGFARPETARVLLCHNPELFPEAAGQVDLQLSGHTHGGQVTYLVRPADLFLRHGFVMGRYERDGSQLYVNRGFGTAGPPIRIATPPEVTKIVLTAR
jgi:predicted MPP superfamily phosphohydrolase